MDGWITPEFGYWKIANDRQPLQQVLFVSAMKEVYANMNSLFYFNRVGFVNVLLSASVLPDGLNGLDYYFRSLTRNFGLDSFLQ